MSPAEHLYGLVLAMYPRHFRILYESEMKLVFREMLEDPNISRWHVFRSVCADVVYALGEGVLIGSTAGCCIFLIWYMTRSDQPPGLDPSFSVSLIVLLLVATGYAGALRSGSMLGGLWAGFVAGVASSAVMPAEDILFSNHPWPLLAPVCAVLVMILVTGGAALSKSGALGRRLHRGVGGFVAA